MQMVLKALSYTFRKDNHPPSYSHNKAVQNRQKELTLLVYFGSCMDREQNRESILASTKKL